MDRTRERSSSQSLSRGCPLGSKFVYRRTSIETAGQLFEWDNFVDPGGGPSEIPHVHPHMREVFQIVHGESRFAIDGHERVAGAGSTVVVQPGTVHAFQNVAGRPAHMISRFEVAEEGPWGSRFKQGYPPGLPAWAWDAIEFLVAPAARLFGVHAYYYPRASPR